VSEFGRIDVLINNAGIAIDKDFNDRTVEDWRKTLDTNLIGAFFASKYAGEYMMKQKSGKIVIVSSTSGLTDFNTTSIDYDASKVALISLTRNLAIQFAPYVTVNAVCPGWVDTDMNKDLPKDYVADETKKILLGRWANPAEIAKPIRFLCSDDASYINGEYIIINGGR
jgi:3-oxoacyl-[acyl-carrier protein] reductase